MQKSVTYVVVMIRTYQTVCSFLLFYCQEYEFYKDHAYLFLCIWKYVSENMNSDLKWMFLLEELWKLSNFLLGILSLCNLPSPFPYISSSLSYISPVLTKPVFYDDLYRNR